MAKARYRETTWAGHKNYECVECPYATLEYDVMLLHVRAEHPSPDDKAAVPGEAVAVRFTTPRAAAIADELGVSDEVLKHRAPSGRDGTYTAADVRAAHEEA